MKKWLIYSSAAFLLTSITLIGSFFYLIHLPQVTVPTGVVFEVYRGMSAKTVATKLSETGVIRYPRVFILYSYFKPSLYLKTGEYQFLPGSTIASIWKQITTGTGLVYHTFTIVPGWTFNQIRMALLQNDQIKHQLQTIPDAAVMTWLGFSSMSPEGQFLPETYSYTKGVSDKIILKRAHHFMQEKAHALWQGRDTGLPYTDIYAALIAASLVEKEAYLSKEKPIIAGVLVNRLRSNMLLQIDPTVIYGMGARYQGKIYKTDLQQDTPYNTYLHKGLPPTPIAMPGLASLYAVLHPTKHNNYYFVARGDGSHQFSENLEAHHQAVLVAIHPQTWYFNEAKVKNYIEQHLVHLRVE